jgi:hypothetical protein
MLQSPAWQAMPAVARQIVDRIVIEHLNHAGQENGKLPVSYDDFAKYGVRRQSVMFAIDAAMALGWIDIVDHGHRGAADVRRAARYALTWVDRHDGKPRTNRWKRLSAADAEAAIAELRRERSIAAGWRAAGRSVA